MTKKIKLGMLGVAAIAATSLPLVLSISCGNNSDGDGTHVDEVYDDGDDRDGDIRFTVPEERVSANPTIAAGTNGKLELLAQYIVDAPDHVLDDLSFNQQGNELMSELQPITGTANIRSAGSSVIPQTTELDETYNSINEDTIMLLAGNNHIQHLDKYLTEHAGDMVSEDKYAILVDGDVDRNVDNSRVASLFFDTRQAGFQAGVQAGLYLNVKKSKFLQDDGKLKVATFGGTEVETVVSYMAGFQQGVNFFNENNNSKDALFSSDVYGVDINLIDNGDKSDYFSGSFEIGDGTAIANSLLDKDADLIFPVAGPQTTDVVNAIKSRSTSTNTCKAQVIGIDMKQEKLPNFSTKPNGSESEIVTNSYVAFSVVKDIKRAFREELTRIVGGSNVQPGINGLGGLTIGTVNNGLVYVSVGQATSVAGLSKTKPVVEAAEEMEDVFRY